MTVAELIKALQAALDRGLPPETTVVSNTDIGFLVLKEVADPSDEGDYDMWFTLFFDTEADCRFTTGGMVSP